MSRKTHNWTEPRVYTDADNIPRRVTIYDMDDGLREVATVGISKDDGPEHIARVKAEFALMSAAPELARFAKSIVKWGEEPLYIGDPQESIPTCRYCGKVWPFTEDGDDIQEPEHDAKCELALARLALAKCEAKP